MEAAFGLLFALRDYRGNCCYACADSNQDLANLCHNVMF